jgi:hypothetical protein
MPLREKPGAPLRDGQVACRLDRPRDGGPAVLGRRRGNDIADALNHVGLVPIPEGVIQIQWIRQRQRLVETHRPEFALSGFVTDELVQGSGLETEEPVAIRQFLRAPDFSGKGSDERFSNELFSREGPSRELAARFVIAEMVASAL